MVKWSRLGCTVVILLSVVPAFGEAPPPKPKAATQQLPSEIPKKFAPVDDGFDFTRRQAEIPMRDGVKLHTVILVPKGTTRAGILLTRTPYNADSFASRANSAHLGPVLFGYDNATDVIIAGGYIRVVQDVRGKYGSEGDYVMNRPLHGPLNPTNVDHATDTYDTIDWLVKNVPESNGKVGIIGISYDGFLPLMAVVNPHPALKVSVAMNPMVDGWMGDDWFHYGAFRQLNLPYIYGQEASRKNDEKWWTTHYDDYDFYLKAGAAGELGRRRGMEQLGFWQKIIEHPSYDAFWQQQAVDKLLAKEPLKVPLMLVQSQWDQEDIHGAAAVYDALEPKDTRNDMVYLTLGPWSHGQGIREGSSLGAIKFGSDTAAYWRMNVLKPFLDQYLVDGAPKADVAPVTAFETGANQWQRLDAWPGNVKMVPLYVREGMKLAFDEPKWPDIPTSGGAEAEHRNVRPPAYDEYVSDPSKPVPYQNRPTPAIGAPGNTWRQWLVEDQRNPASRPDVLTYTSDVLTAPVHISGRAIANLVASTSGTDSDWVVKLIDVYPDEVADDPAMGGYQLMVAGDIFRGRYRESFENQAPLTPDTPLQYRFSLPTVNHEFLPGHRIMVQIQSSWFPLYDRNPQTFVPNIFFAKPEDFRKATQRVYHEPGHETYVELPVAE